MLWSHSESDKVLRLKIHIVILTTTEVDPEQSGHKSGVAGLYFAVVFKLWVAEWEKKVGHKELKNGEKFIPCEKYENIRSQV